MQGNGFDMVVDGDGEMDGGIIHSGMQQDEQPPVEDVEESPSQEEHWKMLLEALQNGIITFIII